MSKFRFVFLLLFLSSCNNNILYNDCYWNCYQIVKIKHKSKLKNVGELRGFLYDFTDNSPLEWAIIEIKNATFLKKMEVKNGKFNIELPEGEYFIKIESLGHNVITSKLIKIQNGFLTILRFKITYEV